MNLYENGLAFKKFVNLKWFPLILRQIAKQLYTYVAISYCFALLWVDGKMNSSNFCSSTLHMSPNLKNFGKSNYFGFAVPIHFTKIRKCSENINTLGNLGLTLTWKCYKSCSSENKTLFYEIFREINFLFSVTLSSYFLVLGILSK